MYLAVDYEVHHKKGINNDAITLKQIIKYTI